MLPVFKCEHLHKFHSDSQKKAKCIDSLIAINSLSLAAFPLFIALPYTGKAAKLKLFVAIRESIHFAFLRIKINLSSIYEEAHTLKDWQHHIVLINALTITSRHTR